MSERPRTDADTQWIRGGFAGLRYSYYARVRRGDGPPVVDALVITGPDIDAAALRALGLRETIALASQAPESAWGQKTKMDDALADLLDAWPKPDPSLTAVQRAAVEALWIRYGGAMGLDDPTALAAYKAEKKAVLAALRPARPALTRPDGTDPEGFSRRVAQAYKEAVVTTSTPAKVLAAEAGVPVTTVHRWIRDARRLGLLEPARKGRAV
jgi:hypothetical protein